VWKWTSSAETNLADFGSPSSTTAYALCLYDADGLRLTAEAPAARTCRDKPCWTPVKTSGFRYADPDGSPDGLKAILLKAGASEKGKITIQAGGTNFAAPSPQLTTPVRVQLSTSDGSACWDATYAASVRSDTALLFKAKSD
jgi:hypothetical protein